RQAAQFSIDGLTAEWRYSLASADVPSGVVVNHPVAGNIRAFGFILVIPGRVGIPLVIPIRSDVSSRLDAGPNLAAASLPVRWTCALCARVQHALVRDRSRRLLAPDVIIVLKRKGFVSFGRKAVSVATLGAREGSQRLPQYRRLELIAGQPRDI